MLYDNEEVLNYLKQEDGKLIHLYGEADAGRTSVLFSMIGYLTSQGHPCAYLVPGKSQMQIERFRRYIKDPSLCPLIIIQDRKTLSSVISGLATVTDYIFIDCFLSYILYRTRRQNASLMSFLSGQAYGNHLNFVLCNDTRHIPGEDKPSPAYMEIFRRYSSKNVLVYKDTGANIFYEFKGW